MDKDIAVGKINPTTDWDKMLVQSAFLRCIRRCNQMGIHGAKCGGSVVAILQPKLLICSIQSHIVGVCDIKFDQEPPVLQSKGIKGDGITKNKADKALFA